MLRKGTLRLSCSFLQLLSPLLQGLFEALGCLFEAFDAFVGGVLYYFERLLISSQWSAEEAQVALGDFGIDVLFVRLLFPLFEHRTCSLCVVSEQRHGTLKDAFGVLQIALLGGRKTLCQGLAGLAKSFDRGFISFIGLFVRHVFAPFCLEKEGTLAPSFFSRLAHSQLRVVPGVVLTCFVVCLFPLLKLHV
jgi:hypothetical protein